MVLDITSASTDPAPELRWTGHENELTVHGQGGVQEQFDEYVAAASNPRVLNIATAVSRGGGWPPCTDFALWCAGSPTVLYASLFLNDRRAATDGGLLGLCSHAGPSCNSQCATAAARTDEHRPRRANAT